MIHLFNKGTFRLHNGSWSDFKIDCDSLTDEDIDCCAYLLSKVLRKFTSIEYIPSGGYRLAEAMKPYVSVPNSIDEDNILIVDDVCTTLGSMEERRGTRINCIGAVIFDRSGRLSNSWITPLFTLNNSRPCGREDKAQIS